MKTDVSPDTRELTTVNGRSNSTGSTLRAIPKYIGIFLVLLKLNSRASNI